MKKTDIAYLAGIMDGDGYFTIRRSTYNIRKIKDSKNPHYYERAGIKQVKSYAVNMIHKFFGGYRHTDKPTAKNGKPLEVVQLTNLKAHHFIKTVYPYLHIRKKQAQILLQLRKSLNKGKTHKVISMHKNRWGKITKFTRYSVSPKEIIKREKWLKQIKSLNDSRNDITHQPLPY